MAKFRNRLIRTRHYTGTLKRLSRHATLCKIRVWQFLGSLQIRRRILLKATSREESCLQVMSHRAPPYNDRQCELKRTVLTCGSHDENVLKTILAFLHISRVALLMSSLSSSEQCKTCPRWVTVSENSRRWPEKENLPMHLTLGEDWKQVNWVLAALKIRLWSLANSSHSLRRILRAEGDGARRVISSA